MPSQDIGELVYKITGNSDGLKFELLNAENQAKKSAQKSGDAWGKLQSRLLGLGIGTLITSFFTSSIGAASDAAETAQKFGVVFSNVQEDAAKSAKNLADNYLLSRTEAKKLLADTGDLLTGFGFTQQAALDLSTRVQTLAGDLASFSNVQGGVTFASEALTKGLFGETEQMKSLGIAISQESSQFKDAVKLRMQLYGETLNQAKAEVIFAEATKQSGNAIGDIARSSESYANQQRRLEANFVNLKEELGNGLLPALQLYQRDLIKLTSSEEGLGAQIGKIGGKWLLSFRLIKDSLALFLNESAESVRSFLSDYIGSLGKAADAIGLESIGAKLKDIADDYRVEAEIFKEAAELNRGSLDESYNAWVAIDNGIQDATSSTKKLGAATIANVKNASDEEKKRAAKLQEEAAKFSAEINRLGESETAKVIRTQQEQLAEVDKFRSQNIISEQEAANLRVKINEDASEKIVAINNKQYQQLAEQAVFASSTIAGLIGQTAEIYSMQTANRLAEIDNEKTSELDRINSTYEADVAAVEASLMTEAQKNEALKALDEARARDEKVLSDRLSKEARKIQREAAERQKALSIAQTAFSIPEAAFGAFKSAQVLPFPASAIVGAALAAAAVTFGALKIKEIAATPLPALAAGGLALGPSIVGEAGRELAVPLDSEKGRAAIDEFSQGLTRTGGNGLTNIQLHVYLNGGEILNKSIEAAIRNGQIIIEAKNISA